jgi:hypothetical protein
MFSFNSYLSLESKSRPGNMFAQLIAILSTDKVSWASEYWMAGLCPRDQYCPVSSFDRPHRDCEADLAVYHQGVFPAGWDYPR